MTAHRLALGAALTLVLAGAAAAQTAPQDGPTAVSPVTVMPRTAQPKVVATYPAQGETIAPGVLIVKVAFDQKMNPAVWNYAAAEGLERPECIRTPRLLNDEKTFVLLCRVLSDRSYAIALNAQPAGGFANLGDNPAEPLVLQFRVVRGEPVTSMAGALRAAGLKSDEEPIQEAPRLRPRTAPC
ncbi:hypothetical protein [Caulobacter sp. HMWF025]|uniref:hypothetical protein n=2 Tax=unclassified Caulobacter TaxID=2648921 RepID=UPI000D3B52D1|nr:hypothetical protein [Caulobacter sp. HMWF025]PTT06544.1 hypothetical protein DBR10_12370 [Caulobacter sp. HMWF025]